MSRLRLFHWKAEEAAPLIATLKAAGHSVEYQEKLASYREARDSPPDAFVIDLSRLPSHGREVAIFLRGSKATRHVPTVFVGGDPEKVEGVRRLLPDASYTSPGRLIATLRQVKPLADPVRPAQMMDRYGRAHHRAETRHRQGYVAWPWSIRPPDYAQGDRQAAGGRVVRRRTHGRLQSDALVRARSGGVSGSAAGNAKGRREEPVVDLVAQRQDKTVWTET